MMTYVKYSVLVKLFYLNMISGGSGLQSPWQYSLAGLTPPTDVPQEHWARGSYILYSY